MNKQIRALSKDLSEIRLQQFPGKTYNESLLDKNAVGAGFNAALAGIF